MCQSIARLLSLGPGSSYGMAPPGTYGYWVRQATRKLSAAPFGQWREDPTVQTSKDVYDREFWTKTEDRLGTNVWVLQVKAGKAPSEAIDAILERPDKWRHDCDHTIQIANLFAIRMVLGAAVFNARVAASLPAQAGMQLRSRGSDGMKTTAHFGRDAANQEWKVVTKYDPSRVQPYNPAFPKVDIGSPFVFGPRVASADEPWKVVGAAPVGSRVRFTNTDAPVRQPFRHENCVKLAYDLYAAGGITDPLIAWYELDEAGVAFHLARSENAAVTAESVREYVYIDEVEVFGEP